MNFLESGSHVFAGRMTGISVMQDEHAVAREKQWRFPQERFVEYEPKDEWWCRKYGFGHEVEVDVPAMYRIGDMYVMHPKLYEQLKAVTKPAANRDGMTPTAAAVAAVANAPAAPGHYQPRPKAYSVMPPPVPPELPRAFFTYGSFDHFAPKVVAPRAFYRSKHGWYRHPQSGLWSPCGDTPLDPWCERERCR